MFIELLSILVCTLHIRTLVKSVCSLLAMNTCLSISLKHRDYRKFKSVTFCQHESTVHFLKPVKRKHSTCQHEHTVKNKHMLIWKLLNFKIRQANVMQVAGLMPFGPRQAFLVLFAYASSEGSVSPEPPLLAHTSSESRGTFRQKARSLAPLNGWACAVKICHNGMLEDTNSLDGAHVM